MKRFITHLSAYFVLIFLLVSIDSCEEKPSPDEVMRKELAYLRHAVDSLKSIAPQTADIPAPVLADTVKKVESITTAPKEVKEKKK